MSKKPPAEGALFVRLPATAVDKLAGGKPFKGQIRLTFEGDALKVVADRTVVIPFEEVRRLASSVAD